MIDLVCKLSCLLVSVALATPAALLPCCGESPAGECCATPADGPAAVEGEAACDNAAACDDHRDSTPTKPSDAPRSAADCTCCSSSCCLKTAVAPIGPPAAVETRPIDHRPIAIEQRPDSLPLDDVFHPPK